MTFTPWLAALVVSSVQSNGLPTHALARLGASPTRLGPVQVAVSADGKQIVTVTNDGQARVFDAARGELVASRRLVERVERNMYNNNNGGALVGLSADGSLALIFDGEDYSARAMRVVETATGKTKLKYPSNANGNTWLASAVMSPDGKKILVNEYGAGNPRHTIVDVATGTSRAFLDQPNGGIFVASGLMQFSPDGTKALLLDTNNLGGNAAVSATCYAVEDAKKLWTEPVGMFSAFTQDSKQLLALGVEKTTGLRDATTGKEAKVTLPSAKEVVGQQTTGPKDLALFPLAAGGSVVWDVKAGKKVAELGSGPPPRGVGRTVAFAPDGSFVVTAFNGHLCRWNLPEGKKAFGDPTPPGSATGVTRLVFAPDGKSVFSLGDNDQPGVWTLADKAWTPTPQLEKPKAQTNAEQMAFFWGGGSAARSAAFTAAGPRYLAGTTESGLEVRDGRTGKAVLKLKGDKKQAGPFGGDYQFGQLSADGATAVAYTMTYTGNQSKMAFETWDVATGAKTNFTEFTLPNYGNMATISPCGRFTMIGGKVLVLASGNMLFSIVKNQQQPAYYYYYGGTTTFSPDGRLMATSQNEESLRGNVNSPGTVHIWDVVTGLEVRKIVTGANANAITFSPDNRLIAFASQKGVKVFDLSDGKEAAFFPAQDLRIPNYYEGMTAGSPVAFAPDGRTLATGHLDGTVTVWQVPPLPGLADVADAEADKFWESLADAAIGRTGVYRLRTHPAAAMKLLSAKFVAPVPKPLDVDLAQVVRRLDAPAFADRMAAVRKLKELGPRVAPALTDAIRTTDSVEVRARCEELLDQMKAGPRTYSAGPELRAARAIEVLEQNGSAEAKRLLQGWANHATNPRLAGDAALALVRIAAAGK